jgi:AraC-like DNA-binding protein/mannose-6-phosphate isomerase-like protein (cupin superfamily)
MNSYDLREVLIAKNNFQPPPDWNVIRNTFHPKQIDEVNGEPVYEFNMIFNIDSNINPIEDNIFISLRPPNVHVPMHTHQYIELIYVYKGKCNVVLRNNEIHISEDGIILIDKNTPHTVKETSEEDIIIEIKLKHDYLSSGFISRFNNKSIISQFLIDSIIDSRRANNYLYFPFEERSNIVGIMEQIMGEYFEKDAFTTGIIDAYFFILFTELIRQTNRSTNMLTETLKKEDNILDFLKYIEDHYKDCSLSELADKFKYHPNYISAVLKKATGKSCVDLLQIQRLNKAALYLANSDSPIPEIAEEVGYSSVSFFYKKFNEIFLQTPKEYRENANKSL